MKIVRDARSARDEAMARVEDHAPPEWKIEAEKSALKLLAYAGQLSSEDVWEDLKVRGVPRPPEPRAMGPVMKKLVRAGEMVPDGYVESTDPIRHARPIRKYRRAE